jgi:GNAT superfamily N-acetyltransferase
MQVQLASRQPLGFYNLSSPFFPFVRSLYETAFPPYERRNWEQLVSMLPLPNMQVIVAKQMDDYIGFAIYWQIENWYFLEHLAVHPSQEGKGLGSQMMQWLLQQSNRQLLLETELPTNEESRRRVRFYEKLGLQIAPFIYQQPPYRRGETTPAMHIMSLPAIEDDRLFQHLTNIIRQQVFEAFY